MGTVSIFYTLVSSYFISYILYQRYLQETGIFEGKAICPGFPTLFLPGQVSLTFWKEWLLVQGR